MTIYTDQQDHTPPTAVIPTVGGMLCQSIDPMGRDGSPDLGLVNIKYKKNPKRRKSSKLSQPHPEMGKNNPIRTQKPSPELGSHPEIWLLNPVQPQKPNVSGSNSYPEMGLPNPPESLQPNQAGFNPYLERGLPYPIVPPTQPVLVYSHPHTESNSKLPSISTYDTSSQESRIKFQAPEDSKTSNHVEKSTAMPPKIVVRRSSCPSTDVSELGSSSSGTSSPPKQVGGDVAHSNPPLGGSSKASVESVVSSKTSSRIERMAHRINRDRKCRLCLWVSAFVCALNVIFFLVAYDLVVRTVAVSQLALHDSGVKFEAWSKTTLPVYYKVFIFNLTNPQEFLDGARPRVEEVGPYVYRVADEKVNVSFHDNDTVTYQTKSTYFFEPSLSQGQEDDLIFTVNIPLVNAADAVKNNAFLKLVVKYAGKIHNFETLRHLTVKELIWGHKSKVLDWGRMFKELPYPHANFGLLTGFNNSIQEPYTMYTGVGDPEKMNAIYAWNGKTKLDFWEGDSCNRIFGTDAGGFRPGVKPTDKLWIFNGQLCRSIPLVYRKTVTQANINAYRFGPPDDVFAYGPDHPQNSCFCAKGHCPPAGVLDMKPCYWGAAIAFSFPHFYNANPTLRHMVLGLRPDPALHSTEFDIFPDLGVPLRVKLRMQMNVILDKNQALNRARHFDIIYPIFWFEAGIDSLPVPLVEKLQMAQDLPPLMKRVFVVICGGLSVVFFILLMAQTFVGWCRGGSGSRGSSNETISSGIPEPQNRDSLNTDVQFPDSGEYKSFTSPNLLPGDRPSILIDTHTLLPPYKQAKPGDIAPIPPNKRKLVGTNSDSGVESKVYEPKESKNEYPPEYDSVASTDPPSNRSSCPSLGPAEIEVHRPDSDADTRAHPPAEDGVTLLSDIGATDTFRTRVLSLKPLPAVPRIAEDSLKKSVALRASPEPDVDDLYSTPVIPDQIFSEPLATSSPMATLGHGGSSHDDPRPLGSPSSAVGAEATPQSDPASTSLSRLSSGSAPENYYLAPPLESDL